MSNLTNPSNKHWMHTKYFKGIKNVCPSGQLMKEMASFYWIRLNSSTIPWNDFEWESRLYGQAGYKSNKRHKGHSSEHKNVVCIWPVREKIHTSITCSFFSITKPESKINNMKPTKVILKKQFSLIKKIPEIPWQALRFENTNGAHPCEIV